MTLEIEEGWKMYIEIHQLKEKGFSHTKIAKMLKISRPTVVKYVHMNPKTFQSTMESYTQRVKKPAVFHENILAWLMKYPLMTSAQIYDWLEEKHKTLTFTESTLRNYVLWVRETYHIPKEVESREFEAMDDPPMGKQLQADFGEIKVHSNDGTIVKLHVMCFVLSNSRHKYCEWQDRAFTTADMIKIHENAFDFFSGIPEEIVYDQDHLILTSENHGDLVYTHAFATYLKKRKFKVHMCRKADPQSKGRIENVVGYVKNNFADNRTFYNLDRWNEDCIQWLHRRGNGKVHRTTRKIPAEVFAEERKYLQPVPERIIQNPTSLSVTYQVRKDNIIPISGNRYRVPRGTYKGADTYVKVKKIENRILVISEIETDIELARYEIPFDKGNLLSNTSHTREQGIKLSMLQTEVVGLFTDVQKAQAFFDEIRKEKPRYLRDQLAQVKAALKAGEPEVADQSLDYCVKNKLFSAVDFKDAALHYSRGAKADEKSLSSGVSPLSPESIEKIKSKPEIRDISEYAKIFSVSSERNLVAKGVLS
jgi:transposase